MVPWWGVAAGENEVRIKQIENKGNGREGKKDNYIINGVSALKSISLGYKLIFKKTNECPGYFC